MYTRIVIAVDGSDEAKEAARRGLELARVFEASVDVLHVVERKALRLTTAGDERDRLRERGRAVLTEIADLASDLGQPVETELREGKPAAEVSDFASERGADLVVVGRQGTTGLGRRLLGGVTEQVLHRSDVPVFVVPDGDQGPVTSSTYTRLLLPTDGSENADAAARHGTSLARQYGAAVHVLNVVDIQAAGGLFSAGGLEKEFVDRLESRGRDAVQRVERAVGETAPELDVETAVVRTTSFDGVAPEIREYVADQAIDAVVMGSHGRSNLGRQLLGSVASTVLRTVDVPVLVVKRES
ncbi:universal stress protein [Halomarina ordinaria]|uniref:Universal stress protein n=1 Tax=Halomarina ordinaria TaxID=3033939 RepID=A0ABD5UFY2_9EURY|nr:universal stress protein [Halomarina sp. PSRA2]